MHSSFAAATLALAVAFATLGTIFTAEMPPPPGVDGSLATEAPGPETRSSFERALHRTEVGLQRMAGLPVH